MNNIPTKLAVVTGAGSGLGRAFCLELASAGGWQIVALDIDEAAAQETVSEASRLVPEPGKLVVPEPGVFRAASHAFDVTSRNAWRELAERLAADHARGALPPLTLLVNNAGICAAAETLDAAAADADQWRRIMEVNYFGVLNGCQALGPLLCKTAALATSPSSLQPAIINIASIAAFLAGPSMSAYAASKAAVVALSEALYAELRPVGVSITVVAPGFFKTGLLDRGTFCTNRHRAEAERLSRNASFTSADVARAALASSRRGKLYCVIGRRARWLWRAKRVAPRLLYRIVTKSYHRTFPKE
jgi:NAD(P)-dependent dehydrogenase (short-subunit alcohol dehydrogenase family)